MAIFRYLIMQMKRNHKIALIAIVPAILFGGFFMADMFTTSESSVPVADAMPADITTPTVDTTSQQERIIVNDKVSYTLNEDGTKNFSAEFTENLGLEDSVEASIP